MKYLNIQKCRECEFKKLPSSLEVLIIGYDVKFKKFPKLPDSLKTFVFRTFEEKDKQIELPKNLKELNLGESFNQKLDKLPSTLEVLIVGNSFKYNLPTLPQSLKTLNLRDYTYPLRDLSYLVNLEKLSISILVILSVII